MTAIELSGDTDKIYVPLSI